jgi:hypothetical protein
MAQAYTPQESLQNIVEQRKTIAFGLFCVAPLLVVLAWWLWKKYPDTAAVAPLVVFLGALSSFGMGVWLLLGLRPPVAPEAATPLVIAKSRPLAIYLFAGSGALLVIGLWLVFTFGASAFPEGFGAILLGLVGLGVGFGQFLTAKGTFSQKDALLESLARHRERVAYALLGCAGVVVILAAVLGFQTRWSYLPEIVGGVLVALVTAGAGLWLKQPRTQPVSVDQMRLVLVVVGGVAGFVIALVTVIRIILWWNEVFAGGMNKWQEPGAYRLWLCGYAEIIGLSLMFASLMLARSEIRSSALIRRLVYGYNAVLTGLLLLVTLGVVNIIVYVIFPLSLDWTQARGLHTLDASSQKVLAALKEPVTIYVLEARSSVRVPDVRHLLENCRALSNKIQIEYISPDLQEERYRDLLKKYPILISDTKQLMHEQITIGRGLLIVYGPEGSRKQPHAFISMDNMFDFERDKEGRRAAKVFKGENLLMNELRFLMQNQVKPKVYFTQGNRELRLEDALVELGAEGEGAGQLLEMLRKDNYEVHGLYWGEAPKNLPKQDLKVYSKKVPDDAKIVVIARPHKSFSKAELDALEEYVRGNGKLIILLDLFPNEQRQLAHTGLEDFLKKFNVQVGDDFVLRFTKVRTDDARSVEAEAPAKSRNILASELKEKKFPFFMARTVSPLSTPGEYQAEVLLEVPAEDKVWAETDVRKAPIPFAYIQELQAQGKLKEKLSETPLPVAVTVASKSQPRMVVVGNAEFASNREIIKRHYPYYTLIASSLEWLTERPVVGGGNPKKSNTYALEPGVSSARMILLPGWLMVLGVIGLGTGIWIIRRR